MNENELSILVDEMREEFQIPPYCDGDYDNLILIEGRNKIEITDGFELKVIPNWRRL